MPLFAAGSYEYASGRWTWQPEMYPLLGLRDDGQDPATLVFERMNPSDRAVVQETLQRAIEAGSPFAGQYRLRDDAGRERAIAFVGDADRDEHGTPVRLTGLAFDVSHATRQAASEAVAAATADRAAIEQVKGALMFTYGLDADAAFGILSRYSQRANVRLAVLAGRVAALLALQDEPGTERSMLRVLEEAVRPGGGVADAG